MFEDSSYKINLKFINKGFDDMKKNLTFEYKFIDEESIFDGILEAMGINYHKVLGGAL